MPSTSPTTTAAPRFSGDLSLNDIVQREPRALDVFNRYGLDSCCGGAKTLALVCERHQLSLDDVLGELHALVTA